MTERESEKTEVSVSGPDVEAVKEALGLAGGTAVECPAAFEPVVASLVSVYRAVEAAQATDERGRSRKIVHRETDADLDVEAVGNHLRVLRAHGLVVRDGNRWRVGNAGRDA